MEGISSSELKQMVKSPAHYKWWKENASDNDTPSLLFGRASHKYILETYDFDNEFAVCPNVDRRSKEGKEAYNKFLLDSEGKDVISEDTFEQIKAMRDALYATPYAKKLLDGVHEESFFWTDESTGLKCKCRPDSYNEKYKVIVDYKTCDDASTDKFMKKSIDLNYDLQAAYYIDGMKANTGDDYIFVFIAQEKKPPYAVNILQANDSYIGSGRDMYKTMLDIYKDCSDSGNWYGLMGADSSISELGLPSWLRKMYGSEE